MQSRRTKLTEHRARRITAWARLWLVWLVGVVVHILPECERHRWLDAAAWVVARMVLIGAGARAPRRAKSLHRYGRATRITHRKLIGSRLRQRLRGRDGAKRLFAVLEVMRDLERHVEVLLRRLRRGLTRLRVIDPERCCETLVSVIVLTPRWADTS